MLCMVAGIPTNLSNVEGFDIVRIDPNLVLLEVGEAEGIEF